MSCSEGDSKPACLTADGKVFMLAEAISDIRICSYILEFSCQGASDTLAGTKFYNNYYLDELFKLLLKLLAVTANAIFSDRIASIDIVLSPNKHV